MGANTSQVSQPAESRLYFDIKVDQWPIVYSPSYNIGFLGMEKLHPFDSGKWGRVFSMLREDGMIKSDNDVVTPAEATNDDLLKIHTKEYLESLKWSYRVAMITEVPPVAFLPNMITQSRLLRPLRLQTGGSILAGKLAMERGWAINIGGGFHHCCFESGGGFCAYADISLCVKFVQEHLRVKKVLIVDLDAHQGNGHERDKLFNRIKDVAILDFYNNSIYPGDHRAKEAITRSVKLRMHTGDDEYLSLLRQHLPEMMDEEKPDLVVYNAGTDVLAGDPLGCLSITPEGVVQRDEIVFEEAKKRSVPVVMLTSGGYQRVTARVIADSILNLYRKGLIKMPE